ncbi:MAG TPA: hypothetical protein VFC33_09215 [Acidimicrobiia bacterium]|nr:hypothetical protein [Acidimicrobiia bacterium]
MDGRLEELAERLRSIEEELRDLAYDRLREAANGDDAAKADERRLGQARRAVERAINALAPRGDTFDE